MHDRNLSTPPSGGSARSSELLALPDAAALLGLNARELLALLERTGHGLSSLNGEPAVGLQALVELRDLPELRRGRLKALRVRALETEGAAEALVQPDAEFELRLLRIQHEQVTERLAVLQATFREQSDEFEELREELALSRARIAALEPSEAKLAATCTRLATTRGELADAEARCAELERAQGSLPATLAERDAELTALRAEHAHVRDDLSRASEDLARSDEGWREERRRAAEQTAALEQRLEVRARELEGLRRDCELAAARQRTELRHLSDEHAAALGELQARCDALELSEKSLSRYSDKLEQRLDALRAKD